MKFHSAATVAATVAALGLGLSGCATITTGTSQSIAVSTNPDGAHCSLTRNGEHLADIAHTPMQVTVRKSGYDIRIACGKDGFQDVSQDLPVSTATATYGNALLGGLIGVGIDSASGAMHQYPRSVNVVLVPVKRDEMATNASAAMLASDAPAGAAVAPATLAPASGTFTAAPTGVPVADSGRAAAPSGAPSLPAYIPAP